jgi:hypothetical protein
MKDPELKDNPPIQLESLLSTNLWGIMILRFTYTIKVIQTFIRSIGISELYWTTIALINPE